MKPGDTEYMTGGPMAGKELVRRGEEPKIMGHLDVLDPALVDHEYVAERRALFEGHDDPHAQRIATAYQAIAEGRQLVRLTAALAKGGALQTDHVPALAVTRAHLKEVRVRCETDGTVQYRSGPRRGKRAFELTVPNLLGTWHSPRASQPFQLASAEVPFIPPHVRPTERPLSEYLILWEAPWRVEPITPDPIPRPPRVRHWNIDPALLEPVVGDFYVVHAAWELTEIEAAALQ